MVFLHCCIESEVSLNSYDTLPHLKYFLHNSPVHKTEAVLLKFHQFIIIELDATFL